MSFPAIINETFVNKGSIGFDVRINMACSFEVSMLGGDGTYKRSDDSYDIDLYFTTAMYISGIIVESGDLVGLTPEGNVPAEFNGRLLTTDAVVVVPEIFEKKTPSDS